MRLNRLVGFLALLLILPLLGFGQTVPVAPNMLLDIGGALGGVAPAILKLDAQGNMYVTGQYGNADVLDFDPSAGVTKLTDAMPGGSFIAKYSAAGALVWVKTLVSATLTVLGADEEVNGLDVDRNGNITVIGWRYSTRPTNPIPNQYIDAFIVHLDNSGNVLWEKLIESGSRNIPVDPKRLQIYSDIQRGYKVASDAAGNLIAVFSFGGSPDVDGKVTAQRNY